MNLEKASDRELPDASTISNEAQEWVKVFCTTLGDLNKIYEEQLKGLADIVIKLAEASDSLSSSKQNEDDKSKTVLTGNELTTLAEKLQSAAETVNQIKVGQQAKMTTSVESTTAENSNAFSNKIESALIMAMENSVSQQQQAFVTGLAILTMGASKLFSSSVSNQSQIESK